MQAVRSILEASAAPWSLVTQETPLDLLIKQQYAQSIIMLWSHDPHDVLPHCQRPEYNILMLSSMGGFLTEGDRYA